MFDVLFASVDHSVRSASGSLNAVRSGGAILCASASAASDAAFFSESSSPINSPGLR